jgi:hypothetical protein
MNACRYPMIPLSGYAVITRSTDPPICNTRLKCASRDLRAADTSLARPTSRLLEAAAAGEEIIRCQGRKTHRQASPDREAEARTRTRERAYPMVRCLLRPIAARPRYVSDPPPSEARDRPLGLSAPDISGRSQYVESARPEGSPDPAHPLTLSIAAKPFCNRRLTFMCRDLRAAGTRLAIRRLRRMNGDQPGVLQLSSPISSDYIGTGS